MQAVIDVGLPVFAIIVAGYLAGYLRILGSEATAALNGFVFYFALPVLLFAGMARVPIEQILNWPFLAGYTGGVLGTFLLSLAAGLLFFPGRPAQLVLQGKAAVFSNTGYMGVPLLLTAFGERGLVPGAVLAVYSAAVLFGLAVVLIELDLRSGAKPLVILRGVGLALMRNPLVMSTVLGLAMSASGLPLPKPIANFCDVLGAAAGPAALFAMGLFLVGQRLTTGAAEVGWLVLLKLVVQPAITWWLCFRVMAMDPLMATSAVLMAGLPTGALTFVLAQRYGLYVQRATAVTLVSTALSVATVSVLLALLDVR